ncbi:DTW domain-containing protein [Cladochytrium replicatum]|nr:DTW domain-containing protein [Cladochytrium replicatum]
MSTENPFEGLQISDTSALVQLPRELCPNCDTSHKIYCKQCTVPLGHTPPKVKLPIALHLFRHPTEREGKTTSVHAKLVAPDDVTITVDNFREIDESTGKPTVLSLIPNPERALVLFPSKDAKTIDEIDPASFDTLIVLDGTWKQARALASVLLGPQGDPIVPAPKYGLRPVKIQMRKTVFWRYQKYGEEHLATIEAIYWFMREYAVKHECAGDENSYDGKYDDLLFYYKHNYDIIQADYQQNPQRQFTTKKRNAENYIVRPPKNEQNDLLK